MNFDLPDDVKELRTHVESFAAKMLAPGALERAHSPEYPWDVSRMMAEQGLLGLTVAEDKGGQGASLLEAIIAIQAIAKHDPRSADVIQAGNFGAIRTLAEYASDEQRDRYLAPLLAGEAIVSLGMTEPGAGSAVTDLATTAVADGGDFLVNGTKIFGTHSAEANFYLVYVRFGPGVGGIGSVIIDRDAPGLTVGNPSRFMNGEEWSQIYFEDVRIPASQVLLGEGGFKKQISGFNVERLGNAARSIAVGKHAFDFAVEHVLTREQFGRPLAEFQGLQWMFAEQAVRLESAQLLLMRAAVEADAGMPSAQATAIAKYAANEAGFGAANLAVQALGGTGFSDEALVEYCFRRTRGWMIAGGSTEVLKNRIAEGVFGRRFSQRAGA
ncbi:MULTISPECIES: acyl-CoA dehydrogenase family protein [Microbacterium]|uniref:Acyl-CoA dehydrogenase n=1 Tax=Microbacterium wangchenii TaxID=2541726 RepID=A0ABX5SYS9_9MICO|nr:MULTISPECIES: acyl-CoA dehydrogenase [Microbacterium]MCK6066137.1 acyl-CoA dehydrogenase [Microbacterium sp. EYE_512]QBR90417.1 acyl-CoA dehydrogenase [Microbacterium wangchenii]TFV84776.1 acyl-CoA dehydrogenase [Microbacterium sp. dk485]TXK14442.1 acyl-CoA dehydrogenase [Microbacterium wangchenii]